MIESLSNINSATPISECIRCGTCCKKGGPSFHIEDKYLIEKGIILSKYLYTIRKGEPAYDNVKEHILPAATDIIKIKGKKGSLACIFFDKKNTLEGLKNIIWYDTHFRLLIAEKGKIEPEMVDFLFGRPLTETIKMFGFKVEQER